MTRLVDLGQNALVQLCNKYAQVKREWRGRMLDLPITLSSDFYTTQGEVFCVCEGEGALYFRDYPRALNFINLQAQDLETYLFTLKLPQDSAQRALIKDFMRVYDTNITKGGYYLNPPFFEDIERELLHGG
ncbi:hypothetical protein [Helicobacter sp. L8]|uniref:hypothetical protein n=1 Tax=Helicobacter sp. L8 TaxID=2316078 RepID=UPI000EB51F8C|nr:hypothetical protein [Helicobacter sp. L8]